MLSQIMVASPAFHDECHHHDHDHDDGGSHECVVDLMLSGGYGIQVPSVTPVEIAPSPPLLDLVISGSSEISLGDLTSGLLAHAPPRGP